MPYRKRAAKTINVAPKTEPVAVLTLTAAPVNSGKLGVVELPLVAGGATGMSVEAGGADGNGVAGT